MALDGYVKQDIGETRMKRVLVLSDSHGNVGNMIRAVKREEPDMILHLGDCVVDADADRKSTRLNSSHIEESRMPSSA